MRTKAPLSSFRVRPRFEDSLALSPDASRQFLLEAFARQNPSFEVKAFPGYICLRIPPAERNFWSPRLTLSLDAAPDHTTRIEGLYGPNANLWSLFLFGYLIIGVFGMFSGILGWAQHVIGSPPWGLWVCGVMAFLALVMYLVAQLGQKFGAVQTYQLHQAYEAAIGRAASTR